MRWLVLVVLAACGDDGARTCTYEGRTYELGDIFPAGDGCNSCSCTERGTQCTVKACLDAGVDASPAFCGGTNGCPAGPACGTICCGRGETCAGGTCRCGAGPACGTGDTCEAAGPLGNDLCGSVCCGSSGPCPQ